MANFTSALTLNLVNFMYKGTILIASYISDELAPKGWSLQLSRNIRAQKPFVTASGDVVGVISSAARSKSGYNYAVRQHNEPLRHITRQPLRTSFNDGQTGKTPRARYAKGYALARLTNSAPIYATEYLTVGVRHKREMLVGLLERAVRET